MLPIYLLNIFNSFLAAYLKSKILGFFYVGSLIVKSGYLATLLNELIKQNKTILNIHRIKVSGP